MQSVGNLLRYDQTVKLDCEQFSEDLSKIYGECYIKYIEESSEDIKALCDYGLKCEGNQINLGQNINVNISAKQIKDVQLNIENALKSQLESNLKQTSGLTLFSNTTKSHIESCVNITNRILADSLEKIYTAMNGKQRVVSFGGTISFVTLEQSQDTIANVLQTSSDYVDIVNTIRNDISADLTQKGKTMNLVWTIVGAVVTFLVVFVLFFLLLRSLRRRRKVFVLQ
jgi:hypothetical protein